jgi:hypothetical protein
MRTDVYSQEGKFNWANPDDVSISTNIRVFDDHGKVIKNVNFRTESEITDNDPLSLADEIESYLKRIWITTQRDKLNEMIKFLRDNSDEIELGNYKCELAALLRNREKIDIRIKQIEHSINARLGY